MSGLSMGSEFLVGFLVTFCLLAMFRGGTVSTHQPVQETEVTQETEVIQETEVVPTIRSVPETGTVAGLRDSKPAPTKKTRPTGKRWARVTAYTKNCKGCSGITRDGTVADHKKLIVAADTRYHPIGTRIEFLIPGSGRRVFTVRDTGGDIKGPNRFDILVSSKSEAKAWGVRSVEFKVLE